MGLKSNTFGMFDGIKIIKSEYLDDDAMYVTPRTFDKMKKWFDDSHPMKTLIGSGQNSAELAQVKKIWYKKGQMSIKRKNSSGCCCEIDDNDEIVSVCGAHEEWLANSLPCGENNTAMVPFSEIKEELPPAPDDWGCDEETATEIMEYGAECLYNIIVRKQHHS